MLPVIEHLRQPMAAGGMWLQPSDSNALPIYVTHEAHIQRLTFDGWQPVSDPRADRITGVETMTNQERVVASEPHNPIETTEPELDGTKRKARRSKPE